MNKKIVLVLVVLALILLGFGVAGGATGRQGVETGNSNASLNAESTLISLKNLKSLRYFASAKMDTLNTKPTSSSSEGNSTAITSKAETKYAVIYGYDETRIPFYLIAHFDRIFEMAANYFDLEKEKNRIVVWVMDFDLLQEIYPGQKNYPGGSPDTVAALYSPFFNYFFFTPRYMNDYYVAHEIVHHFIDEYQEEVIISLPQFITQGNVGGLPLEDFLQWQEERIVIKLSQIIIHKSLASLALYGLTN